MKKITAILMLLFTLASIFSSCKKTKTEPTELSKLPAASQTGANTFGCLVNGKAWVAQTDCKFLCNSPFKVSYNPSFGGVIGVTGDWLNTANNIDQRIDMLIDSSNYKLLHNISIINPRHSARFIDYKLSNCGKYDHYDDSSVIHIGVVNLTRYDLSYGVISGTFNFTLTKPGCETINITEGRFDKKL